MIQYWIWKLCESCRSTCTSRLNRLQALLSFVPWTKHPSFATPQSIGRVGVLGCILGFILGVHLLLSVVALLALYHHHHHHHTISTDTTLAYYALGQWSLYVMALCTFHICEFMVTLLYNPSAASADAFLVNHSLAYTMAAISSWLEFGLRNLLYYFFFFFFTPSSSSSSLSPPIFSLRHMWVHRVGLLGVVLSQCIRTRAMAEAGTSFHHIIQTTPCTRTSTKQQQQVIQQQQILVTTGLYRYVRHPSYVGFFYWCISTQLLLGNVLHALLYLVVSWRFFHTRIAFEEESLCAFFPTEYPAYVARSITGIPFVYTRVAYRDK